MLECYCRVTQTDPDVTCDPLVDFRWISHLQVLAHGFWTCMVWIWVDLLLVISLVFGELCSNPFGPQPIYLALHPTYFGLHAVYFGLRTIYSGLCAVFFGLCHIFVGLLWFISIVCHFTRRVVSPVWRSPNLSNIIPFTCCPDIHLLSWYSLVIASLPSIILLKVDFSQGLISSISTCSRQAS